MKHILLIIGLALSASIPAHANLGDTYAASCARFHSAGVTNRADRSISWPWTETYNGATGLWVITEQFINNHCTAMLLTWQPGPYRGNWINENFVWFALNANAPGRTWTEYGANRPGQRAFATTDGQLYGLLFRNPAGNPCIRIAYKGWMERHGQFSNRVSYDRAPIEESVNVHRSKPQHKSTTHPRVEGTPVPNNRIDLPTAGVAATAQTQMS